jgi:RHS repeat-associated protein
MSRHIAWRLIVLQVLGLALFAGATSAQSWPNGYTYRRLITINHSHVSNTDQTNFPVLISGTYSDLASTANGGAVTNANGYDIIFTSDPNGTNVLPFEQESYSATSGQVIYWVQVPTVSHSADTIIFMFYGNPSITTDQSNKNGTWDSGYVGVWHLPNGTTLSPNDSTSLGNNATNIGSVAAATGKIDGGASFNGTSNYLDSGEPASLQSTTPITASVWLNTTHLNSTNISNLLDKSSGHSNGFTLGDGGQWFSDVYFRIYPGGSGGTCSSTGNACFARSLVNDGNWHYIVGVYDPVASEVFLYLDGVLKSSNSSGTFTANTATDLTLGTFLGGAGSSSADEFRISKTARSADWITTEYNDQSSPSTFYSITAGSGATSTNPAITNLSATYVDDGITFTLTGTGFGSSQGSSALSLNGTATTPASWTTSTITVFIPLGTTGTQFSISVTVNGVASNSVSVSVEPQSLPTPWLDQDIGTVAVAGSASYNNLTGVFTVNGSGRGATGTADGMNFAYQTLSGDGTITARLTGVQGSYYAQAGVMIRETLSPGSTNAFGWYYPSSDAREFYDRPTTGASTSTQYLNTGVILPYWFKVVRTGNTFAAYAGPDGVNWVQIGSTQTITMATNVYIGLGVSVSGTSGLATATFDNISVSSSAAPGPAISGVSATTGSVGSQVTISGSGFGASQSGSFVSLNGSLVTVNSWSDTAIVITIPSGATSGHLLVTTAPSLNDTNYVTFTVETNPLPTPWLDQDIGTVAVAGSASYNNLTGVFTVNGSGLGATSTADGFHFAYQTLSGDGTITARLTSVQGSYYAQAGVMIRETLSPGSTNAFGWYYPTIEAREFYDRPTTGASTSTQYLNSGVTLPYWFRVVRAGNTFAAYAGPDGVNWVQIGSTQTITMATNVYIGLGVSVSGTSGLATATFDNISVSSSAAPGPAISGVSATTGSVGSQVTISGSGFGVSQSGSFVSLNGSSMTINSWSNTTIIATVPSGATSGDMLVTVAPSMNESNYVVFTVEANPLPTPWLDSDIGNVSVAGSASYTSGVFTLSASGQGIGNTADGMHFVYQSLSGDGEIEGRITNVTQVGNTAQAGVMIRETVSPSATNAFTSYFQWTASAQLSERTTTGGTSSGQNLSGQVYLPYWFKLVRTGNTFTAYGAPDGLNWVQIGSTQTITMATNVEVGLALSSQSNPTVATATFDNVSVTAGAIIPNPIISSVSPTIGGFGSSVTVSGSYFGAPQGNSAVSFNGVAASSITSWSTSQIVAIVPNGASSGPVTVAVNGNIPSNTTVGYTVINPIISSISPPAAPSGGTIALNGTGFGASQGSSTVQLNGASLTVQSWSDTAVSVTLPTNATSGSITLTEDSIASNAVQFTSLEALSITSASPTVGSIGATVTIDGAGFGPTQSNSTANFNGVTATIISWSDTEIIAVVPTGATTGPIGVTVAGLNAQGPTFTLDATVQLTDSLGNVSSYTSELIGGQWRLSAAEGSGCSSCTSRGVVTNGYDNYGNVLMTTDELGHTITKTYDANGDLLSASQPLNGSSTATNAYTYNSFGEVLIATDPLGNVTTNTYDSHGNLLSVTTPSPSSGVSGSVTQFAYNSLGELTQIIDPLSHVTTLTYNSVGLIATITDPQNNVTSYGYDARGNRTTVTDATQHVTTFTYDAGNRLTQIAYPDSTTTSFTYDSRGRRTAVTDQNGKTNTYAYDDTDRLTSVTDAANNVTQYSYDTENNLLSITDANGHATSFAYDAFGRVTQTTFPSNLSELYTYDALGNLLTKTDRRGNSIQYLYDALNRLTQKTYPDSTNVEYVYDLAGKIQEVNDPTGTYALAYDNVGRLVGTTTSYSFLASRNFTTAYSYDAASNRIGFTDPEAGSTTYAYDTLNRLSTVTPPAAFTSGSFGFSYDALSRRTQMTRPNGINTNYTYDSLSRLLSVLHQSNASTIDGAVYTVDAAGNRTSKADQLAGVTSNYAYDPLYELTQVTQLTSTTESYSYDPVGNRLSALNTLPSYSYNTSNELTSTSSTSYTYDSNGNMLTKTAGSNTTTYAWDYENRLTAVTLPGTGGTVTFKYDPMGRRIEKVSPTFTSVFVYDGDNLVETTNSTGAVVARYTQTQNVDEPLAELRSGTTTYYEADGLGSVTSLTNAAGVVANTYAYDSYGNTTGSSGSVSNPFQYTGREFDTETNLYYNRARYLDAATGRFISEDPIGFSGGADFYAYVANDPVNWIDPLGLFAEVICEPIPAMRGGWKYAIPLFLSRAHHCFIHAKCDDYDVTIELYGPSAQDPRHGSPHRNPYNPNRGDIRVPIQVPPGNPCCTFENNLLKNFQKESANIPIYSGYPGPNSNTFVYTIVTESGGSVKMPPTAYGWDYRPPAPPAASPPHQ